MPANATTSGQIIDIVDVYDRPVEQAPRETMPSDLVRVRYVAVFVTDGRGELWVPMRRAGATRWASALGFPVGGGLDAGESYEAAARRKTREELGLELAGGELREIAYLSPHKFPVAGFLKVYELRVGRGEAPQPVEHESGRWYKVPELIAELAANELAHQSDFLPVVRLCYGAMKDTDHSVYRP